MKIKFGFIFRILISLIAILGLVWLMRDELSGIAGILKQVNIGLYIIAFILFDVVVIALVAERFKRLLSVHGAKISLREASNLTFIGLFFNNFIPAFGGDLIKAYLVSRFTNKNVKSFATIIMDRLCGYITLAIMSAVCMLFISRLVSNKLIVWSIAWIIVLSIGGLCLLLSRKMAKLIEKILNVLKLRYLSAKIKEVYFGLMDYARHKNLLINSMILSFIAQIFVILTVYVLALSLSINISFWVVVLTVPLIMILTLIPSLNGLGIREGGYVYILGSFIGKTQAFALSLSYLALMLIGSVIGGLIYGFKYKLIERGQYDRR